MFGTSAKTCSKNGLVLFGRFFISGDLRASKKFCDEIIEEEKQKEKKTDTKYLGVAVPYCLELFTALHTLRDNMCGIFPFSLRNQRFHCCCFFLCSFSVFISVKWQIRCVFSGSCCRVASNMSANTAEKQNQQQQSISFLFEQAWAFVYRRL